ncbi:MAG: C40 family peptidase [Marinilabiliaceae bacterium]|nr:C40 family peptidase [Marinilabiliaceae bacterium]
MAGSICSYGFIPVREHATEASQMVTQILFGETYEILSIVDNWARIKLDYDGYEGWIDAKLIVDISEKELGFFKKSNAWIVPVNQVKVISEPDKHSRYLTGGSRIVFNGQDQNSFVLNNTEYYLSGSVTPLKKMPSIQEIAMTYLYTPYLWGGCTFYGIDCSGLVQVIYKILGYKMPRDASQQIEQGHTINFVEEAIPGDLAFFDNENGDIVHVGICNGKGEIIHSSREVRIDKLDHQGIFNQAHKKYTHKLRVIKRII